MKQNTILSGLLFSGAVMMFAGCAQQQPEADGFKLKGHIQGIDSGMVVMQRFDDSERTTKGIDSVPFKNGTFELKGKLESPAMMTIFVKPGNWITSVFVENGEISLEGDTAGAEHFDYTSYGGEKGATIKKVKITGSKNQDDYDLFQNDPKQLEFNKTFAALNKDYAAEKNAELKEKMRSKFDSVGKLSNEWKAKWINSFLDKNPGSAAGAYILSQYYIMNSAMPLPEIDGLLAKINDEGKKTIYYQNILKSVNSRKAVMPGKQAPDFTLLKRDSTAFKLSSLKGKYVMLDFWASWCKPCRAGIPHWKKIYEQYHSKGFEMVSITNDSRRSDWLKALDQEKMPWIQVTDEFPVKNRPARVISEYEAPFLPFYILLDKEGKILVRSGEEKDIDEKLKELLK